MPTKVEEARADLGPYHNHHCFDCRFCQRLATLESAIREEERALTARAIGDYASMPGGTFTDSELESAAGLIREALRAQKVRVLEEVERIIEREATKWAARKSMRIARHFRRLIAMLSEARAEGASEMVHKDAEGEWCGDCGGRRDLPRTPYRYRGLSGPAQPCSAAFHTKEPEPGRARIPLTDEALTKLKEGARRSTRLTGKDMAVTVGPVPEPGGGKAQEVTARMAARALEARRTKERGE